MKRSVCKYLFVVATTATFAFSFNAFSVTEVVDRAMIGVPASCTMSGTGMNSHNAEIPNGTVNSAIGETNVNVFCNDDAGYAIYAIGYTDDTDGKTVLTSSTLGSGSDIITGTATGPVGNNDVSNWAMKLSTQTSPTPAYPVTIQNSFDSFHTVPSEYTLVAKRTTNTDAGTNATGSNFKTTYQAYISSEQLAGTYVGQVKYTLVHPNTTPTPKSTMLDEGPTVCAKMKTLAAGTETTCTTATSDIKAIRMADSLPSGFIASDANTVSTSTSRHPIYIFFDNTNDAGIMYFYTGGYQVVMNPDSSQLFLRNYGLSDISGVATWDSSNVTTLRSAFYDSTFSLTNVDSLSNWDTSKVETLHGFLATSSSGISTVGNNPILNDISGLALWDTSNVTVLTGAFQNAKSLQSLHGLELWDVSKVETLQNTFSGISSLSDISALSNWDTSKVATLEYAFSDINSLSTLSGLETWDVSRVENLRMAFAISSSDYNSGARSQITDISALSNWNTSSVTNMRAMFQNLNKITTLDALANWDVSHVTNMIGAFNVGSTGLLNDASAIKDWDVRAVTATAGSSSESSNNFYNMFYSTPPKLDGFTLRAGTWNSNGTYVPSS